MTLIYAHRGFSATYPENTMVAFQKAAENGADGIELDVQFTKDGEIVVIHDPKVDRTTNGKGYVKDYLLKDIRRLNANNQNKNINTATIPTLDEVLQWLLTTDLFCNIELKNALILYEGLEEEVIRLIYQYDLGERVIISSFNHYSLVDSFRLAPCIETAPLYRDGLFMPWVYASAIQSKGIHPSYQVANNEIIKQSLYHGIKVRPFTINDEKEMKRLFEVGCTAIITDEPAKAAQLRKTYFHM